MIICSFDLVQLMAIHSALYYNAGVKWIQANPPTTILLDVTPLNDGRTIVLFGANDIV